MRTLYLDCGMGAAGDMLTAALLELLPNPEDFVNKLNALGIPGIVFKREPSIKCGITGTHITVSVHGEEEGTHIHHPDHKHEHGHTHHHHSGLHDIEYIVREHLALSQKVQDDIMAVFGLIAEAERGFAKVEIAVCKGKKLYQKSISTKLALWMLSPTSRQFAC